MIVNNYKKIILDNGIPLYLYQDTSMKQVFVNYIVKYGFSGEWFKFNLDGKDYDMGPGYAHYLEHLLLESSQYGDLTNYFSRKGYENNAYTKKDFTTYYFCGTKDIKDSLKKLIECHCARIIIKYVCKGNYFTRNVKSRAWKKSRRGTKKGRSRTSAFCFLYRIAYLPWCSLDTVRDLRPFLRRAESTRRPLAVCMRRRKPCLLTLFLL